VDVWFREDVEQRLAGIAEAVARQRGAVPPGDMFKGGDYNQGFMDCLHAVAASFGLKSGRDPRQLRGFERRLQELYWEVMAPGAEVTVCKGREV
jgi:hypothetical protein